MASKLWCQFAVPQIFAIMKLEKHGMMDKNSTFYNIQHWKIPVLVCNVNFYMALNKRKLYHSPPVVLDTISKFKQLNSCCDVINIWATSFCDIILLTDYSEFVSMDTFHPQWCCQAGGFGMAVHYCWINQSLLHFQGRIEIELSCIAGCHGLALLCQAGTSASSCTMTWGTHAVVYTSTNHSSQQWIVVNSYRPLSGSFCNCISTRVIAFLWFSIFHVFVIIYILGDFIMYDKVFFFQTELKTSQLCKLDSLDWHMPPNWRIVNFSTLHCFAHLLLNTTDND